jgi:hypothetical protein
MVSTWAIHDDVLGRFTHGVVGMLGHVGVVADKVLGGTSLAVSVNLEVGIGCHKSDQGHFILGQGTSLSKLRGEQQ